MTPEGASFPGIAMNEDTVGLDGASDFRGPGGCPECGDPLEFSGGCALCRTCGYSPCG